MSTGTIVDPYTLAQALTSLLIKPGHTVYLRGGVYHGDVTSTLIGTPAQPITICPYPGEHPIIDGHLKISGSDTVWRDGIEFRYSGWTSRKSAFNSLTPPDMPYDKTLEIRGPRTKVINCIMHDLAECELWEVAPDSTMYGNVIWNTGFDQLSNGGVGHCLYTQNDTGTPTIHNNIFVSAYNFGLHAYGTSAAHLANYDIRRNIQTNVRMLIGGLGVSKVTNVTINTNRLYGAPLNAGYNATHNTSVDIQANIIADVLGKSRLQIAHFDGAVTVRGNTMVGTGDTCELFLTDTTPATVVFDWDANTYWLTKSEPGTVFFETPGLAPGFYTFAAWKQAFGFDATSIFHNAATPHGAWIDVFPNAYGGAHLGSISIYNWDAAPTVDVDLASLNLVRGATYKLRNAANYMSEWQLCTYDGSPITLAMGGWTVAPPIAAPAPLFPSTFPAFGAFVVTL